MSSSSATAPRIHIFEEARIVLLNATDFPKVKVSGSFQDLWVAVGAAARCEGGDIIVFDQTLSAAKNSEEHARSRMGELFEVVTSPADVSVDLLCGAHEFALEAKEACEKWGKRCSELFRNILDAASAEEPFEAIFACWLQRPDAGSDDGGPLVGVEENTFETETRSSVVIPPVLPRSDNEDSSSQDLPVFRDFRPETAPTEDDHAQALPGKPQSGPQLRFLGERMLVVTERNFLRIKMYQTCLTSFDTMFSDLETTAPPPTSSPNEDPHHTERVQSIVLPVVVNSGAAILHDRRLTEPARQLARDHRSLRFLTCPRLSAQRRDALLRAKRLRLLNYAAKSAQRRDALLRAKRLRFLSYAAKSAQRRDALLRAKRLRLLNYAANYVMVVHDICTHDVPAGKLQEQKDGVVAGALSSAALGGGGVGRVGRLHAPGQETIRARIKATCASGEEVFSGSIALELGEKSAKAERVAGEVRASMASSLRSIARLLLAEKRKVGQGREREEPGMHKNATGPSTLVLLSPRILDDKNVLIFVMMGRCGGEGTLVHCHGGRTRRLRMFSHEGGYPPSTGPSTISIES